jgi:hypothetical protein
LGVSRLASHPPLLIESHLDSLRLLDSLDCKETHALSRPYDKETAAMRVLHTLEAIASESIGIIGMEGNSIKPELSAIDAQKQ